MPYPIRVEDRSTINRLGEDLVAKIDLLISIRNEMLFLSNNVDKIESFNLIDFTAAEAIRPHLEGVTKVSQSLGKIDAILSKIDKIDIIYADLPSLLNLKYDINKIESLWHDFCYLRKKSEKSAEESEAYKNYVINFYEQLIKPKAQQVNDDVNRLSNELAQAVQTISDGHDMARKLIEYSLSINMCLFTYEDGPFITIDDEHHSIIFNIPQPVCFNNVTREVVHIGNGECECDEVTQEDVNDAFPDAPPSFVAPTVGDQAFSIRSGAGAGAVIGQVVVLTEGTNSNITFALTPIGEYIASQQGLLTTTSNLTYHSQTSNDYVTTFTATSDDGTSDPANVTVTVTPPDTPTIDCAAAQDRHIGENNNIGDVIHTFTGDDGGHGSYARWSTTSTVVDIDQNTGVMTAVEVYDFETTSSYSITVKYGTMASNSTCDITLHVDDSGEVPVIADQTMTIAEGNDIGDNIGQLVVISGGSQIAWHLGNSVHIDATTEGMVRAQEVFDYDVENQFTVNIVAQNAFGFSDSHVLTVNVTEQCVETSACMILVDTVEAPDGVTLPAGTVVGTPDVAVSATEWQEGCPINFELMDNNLLTFNGTNFVNTNDLAVGEYTTDYETKSLQCTYAVLTRTLKVIDANAQVEPLAEDYNRILSGGRNANDAIQPIGTRIASIHNIWGAGTTFSYVSGGKHWSNSSIQLLSITPDGDFYITNNASPGTKISNIVVGVSNSKGSANITFRVIFFADKHFQEVKLENYDGDH